MGIVLPGRQQFRVSTPIDTHWAPADCADVDCAAYIGGWETILDPVEHPDLVEMVRSKRHGRRFTERRESGTVRFTFPPGQQCFEKHLRKTDKPEIFTHAHQGGVRRFDRPEEWAENMNEQIHRVERGQA